MNPYTACHLFSNMYPIHPKRAHHPFFDSKSNIKNVYLYYRDPAEKKLVNPDPTALPTIPDAVLPSEPSAV